MTNLAEHIIVAGAENRPPMLEKSIYDSWASLIRLFIKGKKHGRMMLDLIDNGPMMTDVQATNIILHGLPPDVYALVNHQEVAKDIWDKVKQLMKGTELSYEERECRLYNLFDKLASQVQVNTKFLNALPPEWSKFVTDVKLAKSLSTINYDQFKERIRLNTTIKQWHSYLLWYQGFHLQTINSECLPILEIRQPFKMEESQFNKFKKEKIRVLLALEKGELLQLQGETMQCTQPKRPRNSAWFKEKLMLVEAQKAGQILDSEQLAFIADPGIEEALVAQQTIPQNLAFQTEHLDAYDSDCDVISWAKAVLMANLSSYNSDVLSEVPYYDTYPNDMINQDVQEMSYSE
ncbi:hypothetical protein Tco_0000437 [Tanacetum coccineum]